MATNKEIVEGIYTKLAQGDVPGVLGAMAEDIQWVEAEGSPLPGTFVGPQAVLEGVLMRLGEIGDEFAVVPDQFVAEGDTVVVLGNYSWKHKSSGEPALVKMAHVYTVVDGKLATFQQHVDTVRVQNSADADRPTLRRTDRLWPLGARRISKSECGSGLPDLSLT